MLRYLKNNSRARYHTAGKQSSIETYTTGSIFKVSVKDKKMMGKCSLPSHLSKMTLVRFKVAKKAIKFVCGENDVLQKPSKHVYSSRGTIKPCMMAQFFCFICVMRIQLGLGTVMFTKLYAFLYKSVHEYCFKLVLLHF